ncbi:DUF5631 domain-containing protein [Mycolicibacillus trivialis]
MISLPPGPFSELLVGAHWPSDNALESIQAAAKNRNQIEVAYTAFADQLQEITLGPLNPQSGETADKLRDIFRLGEGHARSIAESNNLKRDAYLEARSAAISLRESLTAIAATGNQKIRVIQSSNDALPEKVSGITDVVIEAQLQADRMAAASASDIFTIMQGMFDQFGLDISAREFSNHQGIDSRALFGTKQRADIEAQVADLLNKTDMPSLPPRGESNDFVGELQAMDSPGRGPATAKTSWVGTLQTEALAQHATAVDATNDGPNPMLGPLQATPTALAPTPSPSPTTSPAPTPPAPATLPPVASQPAPAPAVIPANAAPLPTTNVQTTPTASSPTVLQAFEQGMTNGPTPVHPTATPAPLLTPLEQHMTPAVTDMSPSATHVTAIDTPPAVSTPPAEAVPPYLPVPPVAALPASVTAAPPVASSPLLPGYGTDLRSTLAPAATVPAAPPSSAPSPTPTPAHAQTGLGQSTVVRRTPAPPPLAVTEQAVPATAGGALSGALSAQASAENRLRTLVEFVARQEPRLHWSVGQRDDATAMLVTDLAAGWIPPHVAVPATVRLLDPAPRRGTAMALLGSVSAAAHFEPGQYVAPADRDDHIPTSSRPRHGPNVEELGWQLRRSTRWRDGLPRLAHTLVHAVYAGAGVLDTEVALLRTHLAETRETVLADYPEKTPIAAVGNWQLLAAIEALITDDRHVAMYHYAWFRACCPEAKS